MGSNMRVFRVQTEGEVPTTSPWLPKSRNPHTTRTHYQIGRDLATERSDIYEHITIRFVCLLFEASDPLSSFPELKSRPRAR
jgi:hypothetical protein